MERMPFILYEKFRSENEEQRRKWFQEAFERYIVSRLSNDTDSELPDG